MSDYDNTNTGALFKNDKKQSERHPDYRGSANVNGVEYWMSAWIKKSKSGQTFMSFSYTPKEDQPAPVQDTVHVAPDPSDLPF